jgi:hypothetical protein
MVRTVYASHYQCSVRIDVRQRLRLEVVMITARSEGATVEKQ